MTFLGNGPGDAQAFQTSPSATYDNYSTTGSDVFGPAPLPGSTAVTVINGASGPTITFTGGTTGYGFVAAGPDINLVVSSAGTIRTSISAAKSGANSDITSLTALTLAVISTLRWLGFVSAANDPTTTELPTAKDVAIYKNTLSGNVFLAFNNAGVIVKVQLT